MRSSSRRIWLAVLALAIVTSLAGASRPARAELTSEVVKAFGVPDSGPDSGRSALVVGSDGAFYGTTGYGGSSNRGEIFRIDAAGNLTRLHSFSGADGSDPSAALVLGTEGALYGTTWKGGSFDGGTVFKIDSAGAFTSLHSFDQTGRPSYHPDYPALVLGSDGALYGITHRGPSGADTVFRIDSAGSFATLHSFSGTDGAYPQNLVLGSDGALYGAAGGGAFGMGTIFRVDSAGVFITLHSFSGADGRNVSTSLRHLLFEFTEQRDESSAGPPRVERAG